MKILLSLVLIFPGRIVQSQDPAVYNEKLAYQIITNTTILENTDSLEALIVTFDNDNFQSFSETISNNPQLIEIQLINPTQKAIDIIGGAGLDQLTHLLIVNGNHSSLRITNLPKLELLSIESDNLSKLSMNKADLSNLTMLTLDVPELTKWKCQKRLNSLVLIDLNAPKLKSFPIQYSPLLTQLSFQCSLKELPAYLCNCEDLRFFSFENYAHIDVSECFQEKVRNANHSNISVYGSKDGDLLFEWISKDN